MSSSDRRLKTDLAEGNKSPVSQDGAMARLPAHRGAEAGTRYYMRAFYFTVFKNHEILAQNQQAVVEDAVQKSHSEMVM